MLERTIKLGKGCGDTAFYSDGGGREKSEPRRNEIHLKVKRTVPVFPIMHCKENLGGQVVTIRIAQKFPDFMSFHFRYPNTVYSKHRFQVYLESRLILH